MKKKILIVIVGFLLILAGVYYSFTYQRKAEIKSDLLILRQPVEEQSTGMNIDNDPMNSKPSQGLINLEQNDHEKDLLNQVDSNEDDIMYIHVCGAVINPGVYQGSIGMRIVDFIELAGGLIEGAAGDYINQAQLAIDGQRLYIPTLEELNNISTAEYIEGDRGVNIKDDDAKKLVNINDADAEELMNIPGIGQSKANSIIEYRKSIGNFKSIEELMNISGIKEGLFNQISSYITVK